MIFHDIPWAFGVYIYTPFSDKPLCIDVLFLLLG